MKKLLLLLFAGAFARQVTLAAAPEVSLRVLPERDYVYTGGPREVIVQIEIEGRKIDRTDKERPKRVPTNLAVVLDRSGSMAGAKIEKARQAAAVALDQLEDDDLFSLVVYSNDTDVLIPAARVGGRGNRDELKAQIDRIRSSGGTALYAGVTAGAREVRRHLREERVNRVILLSDGLANVGPSRTSDLAELGRELRREGLAVTTVGLGDDYNEDLMTALAESSHGNYYYVRDAEKLPGIFSEELGVARSLLARGVTIRITVPEGVRLKEIIGRPEIECRERRVEIAVPEFFGAEKRRYLARCVVESPVREALQVADVALSYETAEGKSAPAQSQVASVKFTETREKADESVRSEVGREVNVVQNRLAKERAVQLADEGRVKDAAQVLRQQAIANAAAPAAAQVPGVADENRKLDAAAAEIESRGQLEKSSRKAIQYENWQDKYQKR